MLYIDIYMMFYVMTLDEYYKMRSDLSYVSSKLTYNFGILDSRWLERKFNNNDETYSKDRIDLMNIYKNVMEYADVIKKYI